MNDTQWMIPMVFFMLVSCGAFGAILDSWVGICMALCVGLVFGLSGGREDVDESQDK